VALALSQNQVFNPELPKTATVDGGHQTGFSIGIEVGDIGLFEIARQWTLLGTSVVKAFRLATSRKNVGDTYVGANAQALISRRGRSLASFHLIHEELETKDPPGRLAAYRVVPD
jgi:hypothetical protein